MSHADSASGPRASQLYSAAWSSSKNASLADSIKAKLDTILTSHVAVDGVPKDKLLGSTFIVLGKNGTLYSGSAGRSSFEAGSAPYGPDTLTWVASFTKLVTATALTQLVEKGALSLDEDVRPHLPSVASMQILKGFNDDGKPILEDNTKPITAHHLLTHTSGLGYDVVEPDIMRWAATVGRTAINLNWNLDGFTTPLVFPPGEGWRYGTSIDWVGQLIEKLSGVSLGAYLQQHIFGPLGMRDTGFWPAKLPATGGRAVFAHRNPDTGELHAGPAPHPDEHDVESGGAGLYSTANDYARFVSGLLGGRLLAAETVGRLFQPRLDERQRTALDAAVGQMHDMYKPEFPPELPVSFSYAGMVNLEDSPGKRRKGSVMWSGMVNGHWWIDLEAGIAGILVTTVLPPGDSEVKALYHELETAVYAGLAG